MARIYRPAIVRYVDPATGKRCSKDTPGAVKRKVKSKTWRGEFRDADGILRSEPLSENKAAAQAMLSDRIRQVQSGDPFHAHRRRPLAEHLADFRSHLEAKNSADHHVQSTVACIRSVMEGCRFRRISEISASAVSGWLKDQRDGERFGISQSNHYLTALKSFCTWLVKDRRAGSNPLVHLSKLNADTDVRVERRALTADELARLVSSTRESETVFRGLSGADRAMLYLTASLTGLRASELASLTVASFDFNAGTLTVDAAYSKRRREDVMPLHAELSVALREWLETRQEREDAPAIVPMTAKPSDAKLWPGSWNQRAAKMIRADLQAAGIPCETNDGVADFHALRHSFITALATSGVHPKDAQTLARHSTITLTMDRYSHVSLRDSASALARLTMPSLPEALQATGTDDDEFVVAGMVAVVAANSCDSVRRNETIGQSERESENATIPAKNAGFPGDSEDGAGRIRTCGQAIMSRLL